MEANAKTEAKKNKTIVVCCDGTGNQFIDHVAWEPGEFREPETAEHQRKRRDPEGSNSNVVKLYTALRVHNGQVGYYHPGVGTADDPTAKGWMARKWSVLKGLAFADGFKGNVLDAYQYLMRTYDDDDDVYLVGFSRGAYTVRALAGLLDSYGLLCRGNEGHLQYAWNAYIKQHDDRSRHVVKPNHAFKETFSRPKFRVHFMGIWDTVSSVGWVNTPLRLFNVAQSTLIRTGRHAISIDERRCFYRDNLWGEATPGQDLLQVWFPGVHSDIGGSYPQRESGLPNDALRWMLAEAAAAGLELKENRVKMLLGEYAGPTGDPDEDRKMKALEGLYGRPTPYWHVHASLKGFWWWALEFLPHRYYDKDDGMENWRTPLGMLRRIPKYALIHESVVDGMREHGYAPKNLRGGAKALKPVGDGLYRYEPEDDSKPKMNETIVRWAVMIGVSTAELLVLALAVWCVVLGVRAM